TRFSRDWSSDVGSSDLDDVFAGIDAALRVGFDPVKLNAVPMRGVNDDEFADLLRYAIDVGAHLRFIEQMPLDAGHTWDRVTMVKSEERRVGRGVCEWGR